LTQKRLGFFDLGWWKLRRLCSLVSGRGGLEQINFLHFLRAITRLVECLHRVRVDLGVGRGRAQASLLSLGVQGRLGRASLVELGTGKLLLRILGLHRGNLLWSLNTLQALKVLLER
jgi:hypothetical protein